MKFMMQLDEKHTIYLEGGKAVAANMVVILGLFMFIGNLLGLFFI